MFLAEEPTERSVQKKEPAAKPKEKELTLGSPDSQIANNFYRGKDNYDNFLLNQKPISYRNTEDQEIGLFNQGKSSDSLGLNQQFRSYKQSQSPNTNDLQNDLNSTPIQGTMKMVKTIKDQDREMLKTSPSYSKKEYSQLEQKIQSHQRRV